MTKIKAQALKIGIVDDQPLARRSLKAVLSRLSPTWQWASDAENGEEAITLTQEETPDLLLMDIGMPVLDGISATQTIKQQCPHVKIIMLTTHSDDSEILDAFRAGADGYCLKETTPEAIISAIHTVMKGASWIDPLIAQVVIRHSLGGNSEPPNSTNKTKKDPNNELLSPLTEREEEVLALLAVGKNNGEIAEDLHLSLNTVKTHLKSIFMKLDVTDRTGAALKALKLHLVPNLQEG